jgi:hypothetical protein
MGLKGENKQNKTRNNIGRETFLSFEDTRLKVLNFEGKKRNVFVILKLQD